jgi:hypothetical protein
MLSYLSRCFPHIVNLACKAVLKAMTMVEYAAEDAGDFIPDQPPAETFVDALERDPVACVRSLIKAVCLLSVGIQLF